MFRFFSPKPMFFVPKDADCCLHSGAKTISCTPLRNSQVGTPNPAYNHLALSSTSGLRRPMLSPLYHVLHRTDTSTEALHRASIALLPPNWRPNLSHSTIQHPLSHAPWHCTTVSIFQHLLSLRCCTRFYSSATYSFGGLSRIILSCLTTPPH